MRNFARILRYADEDKKKAALDAYRLTTSRINNSDVKLSVNVLQAIVGEDGKVSYMEIRSEAISCKAEINLNYDRTGYSAFLWVYPYKTDEFSSRGDELHALRAQYELVIQRNGKQIEEGKEPDYFLSVDVVSYDGITETVSLINLFAPHQMTPLFDEKLEIVTDIKNLFFDRAEISQEEFEYGVESIKEQLLREHGFEDSDFLDTEEDDNDDDDLDEDDGTGSVSEVNEEFDEEVLSYDEDEENGDEDGSEQE